MPKRNIFATLRSDNARDVERYAEREVTALLYGATTYEAPMLEACVTRMADGTSYGHINARGESGGQRVRLMQSVPLNELGAAKVLVPLTEQDVTDISAAIRGEIDLPSQRIAQILMKLQGRR